MEIAEDKIYKVELKGWAAAAAITYIFFTLVGFPIFLGATIVAALLK